MEHMNSENSNNVNVVDRPPGKTKRKRELAHPKKLSLIHI